MVSRSARRGLIGLALLIGGSATGQEIAPSPAILAPLAPRALVLDIEATVGGLIAVGERGHILLGNAAGEDWRQAPAPHDATLTAIAASPDGTTLLAVGHGATVLRSLDGGESWRLAHFAPEWDQPLLDVVWLDTETAVAVGAYGLVLIGSAEGADWREGPVVETIFAPHLYDIDRSATGLIAVGEAGALVESRDGGESWIVLDSPYEGSFFGHIALAESAWLYGLRGHVFRAEAQDWRRVMETGEAGLFGAVADRSGGLYLLGASGTLLKLDSGGSARTWRHPQRLNLTDAVMLSDGSLLIGSDRGLWRFDPDAETWQAVP